MLTIQGKSLTGKTQLFEDFAWPLPPEFQDPGEGGILLRDMIERIVAHEVQAFNKRQKKSAFVRALSARQIQ